MTDYPGENTEDPAWLTGLGFPGGEDWTSICKDARNFSVISPNNSLSNHLCLT